MAGQPFTILGTAINECPVSLLEVESANFKNGLGANELVQLFARSQVMHEAFGVSLYGGDLNKWPARLVDAFVLLQEEHRKVENLRNSASAHAALTRK